MDVKQTDLGRTVYGGGGITPDEKYEAPKLDPFEVAIYRKSAFFQFFVAVLCRSRYQAEEGLDP
jgi:carboxyl-terminal processing protease